MRSGAIVMRPLPPQQVAGSPWRPSPALSKPLRCRLPAATSPALHVAPIGWQTEKGAVLSPLAPGGFAHAPLTLRCAWPGTLVAMVPTPTVGHRPATAHMQTGGIMVGHAGAEGQTETQAMMQTLTLPREQLLPDWRAAVLAYRAARQVGRDHHAADAEAIAAFRKMLPDMREEEAVAAGDRLRGHVSHEVVLEACSAEVGRPSQHKARAGPLGTGTKSDALRQPKAPYPRATALSDTQTKVCASGPSRLPTMGASVELAFSGTEHPVAALTVCALIPPGLQQHTLSA
jgi:hypothetical protein